MSRNQQLIRLDFEKNFASADKSQLLKNYQMRLTEADLVVFSDYDKGCLSHVQDMIQLAKKAARLLLSIPKETISVNTPERRC